VLAKVPEPGVDRINRLVVVDDRQGMLFVAAGAAVDEARD